MRRSCGTTKEWRRASRGPMSTSSSTAHNSESKKHQQTFCAACAAIFTKACLFKPWCCVSAHWWRPSMARDWAGAAALPLALVFATGRLCAACRHVVYEDGWHMFTLGVAFVSWKIIHVTSSVTALDVFTMTICKRWSSTCERGEPLLGVSTLEVVEGTAAAQEPHSYVHTQVFQPKAPCNISALLAVHIYLGNFPDGVSVSP